MLWIAITFILIIVFDWKHPKNKKVKLRNRIIPLIISLLLLVLAEVIYALKDNMNLAMLSHSVGENVKEWLFGKT